MNATIELDLLLFAAYFQFYLQDEDSDPALIHWTTAEVNALLGVTPGNVVVGTARNSTVPVKIAVFELEPPYITDEQALALLNECDLTVSSGKVIVAGLNDYQPEALRLALPKGIYRIRIYYYNLDELSEDGLDGNDTYTIHLWQTDAAKGTSYLKGYSSASQ